VNTDPGCFIAGATNGYKTFFFVTRIPAKEAGVFGPWRPFSGKANISGPSQVPYSQHSIFFVTYESAQ
jgi:hypothetical protein